MQPTTENAVHGREIIGEVNLAAVDAQGREHTLRFSLNAIGRNVCRRQARVSGDLQAAHGVFGDALGQRAIHINTAGAVVLLFNNATKAVVGIIAEAQKIQPHRLARFSSEACARQIIAREHDLVLGLGQRAGDITRRLACEIVGIGIKQSELAAILIGIAQGCVFADPINLFRSAHGRELVVCRAQHRHLCLIAVRVLGLLGQTGGNQRNAQHHGHRHSDGQHQKAGAAAVTGETAAGHLFDDRAGVVDKWPFHHTPPPLPSWTTRPSSIRMMRSASRAMSLLWVIMTTVW